MKGLMPSSTTVLIFIINFLFILNTQIIWAHREHRVHNIVLYPDKNSWCKTLPIKQIISYPDFKSEEIDNNVCVGACFSYSIPHTEPSDPGEVIVPYCDSCQPSETTWHDVTLKSETDLTTTLLKRVQIITNCSCSPCEKTYDHQSYDDWVVKSKKNINSIESEINDLDQQNDVPDLIDLLESRNITNNNNNDNNNNININNNLTNLTNTFYTTNNNVNTNNTNADKVRNLLNHKIILLLKNIQENNLHYDKVQLIELLKMLKISDHKITHKYIEEFVDTLSDDNIEIDFVKLNEILTKYDNDIMLQSTGSRIESKEHNSHDNDELINHTHHQTLYNHHNHGVNHNHQQHGKHNHGEHSKTHHVGDYIEGHGHLTHGPHKSLVIQPDEKPHHHHHHQHEKLLDVNPHELKPNHAGTMLSYANHPQKKSKLDD